MASYAEQRKRLDELVTRAEVSYALAIDRARRAGKTAPVRHKCFVSYHGADIDAVTDFVEQFNDVFIPRVIGASDSDQFEDPIDSKKEEYVKEQIRTKYLRDSTVTILFVGKCAWARKYVDWELSSTLRDDPKNKRSGLMAITPADKSTNTLPTRFSDNWAKDNASYAEYYYYPTSAEALRNWIEDAFQARTARASLLNNKRVLKRFNSEC